jgi:hypothetical protein
MSAHMPLRTTPLTEAYAPLNFTFEQIRHVVREDYAELLGGYDGIGLNPTQSSSRQKPIMRFSAGGWPRHPFGLIMLASAARNEAQRLVDGVIAYLNETGGEPPWDRLVNSVRWISANEEIKGDPPP